MTGVVVGLWMFAAGVVICLATSLVAKVRNDIGFVGSLILLGSLACAVIGAAVVAGWFVLRLAEILAKASA